MLSDEQIKQDIESHKELCELVAKAHEAATLRELGEYKCDECSTPNFIHLVIPIKDWESLARGEMP